MNEPSQQKLLNDMESLIHALLDCILDGKRIEWNGYAPKSVTAKMEKGLEEGKLDGYFKEKI